MKDESGKIERKDSKYLLNFILQFNEKCLKDFDEKNKDRGWGKEIVDDLLLENRR